MENGSTTIFDHVIASEGGIANGTPGNDRINGPPNGQTVNGAEGDTLEVNTGANVEIRRGDDGKTNMEGLGAIL